MAKKHDWTQLDLEKIATELSGALASLRSSRKSPAIFKEFTRMAQVYGADFVNALDRKLQTGTHGGEFKEGLREVLATRFEFREEDQVLAAWGYPSHGLTGNTEAEDDAESRGASGLSNYDRYGPKGTISNPSGAANLVGAYGVADDLRQNPDSFSKYNRPAQPEGTMTRDPETGEEITAAKKEEKRRKELLDEADQNRGPAENTPTKKIERELDIFFDEMEYPDDPDSSPDDYNRLYNEPAEKSLDNPAPGQPNAQAPAAPKDDSMAPGNANSQRARNLRNYTGKMDDYVKSGTRLIPNRAKGNIDAEASRMEMDALKDLRRQEREDTTNDLRTKSQSTTEADLIGRKFDSIRGKGEWDKLSPEDKSATMRSFYSLPLDDERRNLRSLDKPASGSAGESGGFLPPGVNSEVEKLKSMEPKGGDDTISDWSDWTDPSWPTPGIQAVYEAHEGKKSPSMSVEENGMSPAGEPEMRPLTSEEQAQREDLKALQQEIEQAKNTGMSADAIAHMEEQKRNLDLEIWNQDEMHRTDGGSEGLSDYRHPLSQEPPTHDSGVGAGAAAGLNAGLTPHESGNVIDSPTFNQPAPLKDSFGRPVDPGQETAYIKGDPQAKEGTRSLEETIAGIDSALDDLKSGDPHAGVGLDNPVPPVPPESYDMANAPAVPPESYDMANAPPTQAEAEAAGDPFLGMDAPSLPQPEYVSADTPMPKPAPRTKEEEEDFQEFVSMTDPGKVSAHIIRQGIPQGQYDGFNEPNLDNIRHDPLDHQKQTDRGWWDRKNAEGRMVNDISLERPVRSPYHTGDVAMPKYVQDNPALNKSYNLGASFRVPGQGQFKSTVQQGSAGKHSIRGPGGHLTDKIPVFGKNGITGYRTKGIMRDEVAKQGMFTNPIVRGNQAEDERLKRKYGLV